MIWALRTAPRLERYKAFGSPLEEVQKEQSSLSVMRERGDRCQQWQREQRYGTRSSRCCFETYLAASNAVASDRYSVNGPFELLQVVLLADMLILGERRGSSHSQR